MIDKTIALVPNVHSKTTLGGKAFFEMIELCHSAGSCPQGLVHVDMFHEREDDGRDAELYRRLSSGETVMVRLEIVQHSNDTTAYCPMCGKLAEHGTDADGPSNYCPACAYGWDD